MVDLTALRPNRRQRLAAVLHRTRLMPALTLARSVFVRDLRILAYHRVLSVDDEQAFDFDLDLVSASAQQFRQQMALLGQRFNPIRFRDVIDACDHGTPLPPRPVIVTFDDGYDDNYRIAFPILRELGVPATFFVSTGHIDSGRVFAYDWLVHMVCRSRAPRLQIPQLAIDQPLPDGRPQRRALASDLLDRMKWLDAGVQAAIIDGIERQWSMPRNGDHADCRPMSWDQLREMQAAGMEIGSHGVWHNMLAKLPPDDMADEIVRSRDALARELGAAPVVLSYPVGGSNAYNEDVIRAAREAGFRMGCSYVSGTNPLPTQAPFELRRLPVERHVDLAWFAALIGLPEAFSYPSRQRIG
jgi:peptidoglycan/xylan/chitin deacetylase (PgdA/CDA1 family)